ncbi:hypothetical protein [Mycobacteroides abscessus]|uniref:hypothetical protein n=1 Tax=Mycobacteroides abscessus TaxID=36809 RepID=UPI0009A871AD|nr:hypothetical protein [Mycobacteroides abscessus]SKO14943.1 Uncharacterised protein [Mycobacteroides abscessus subsp. bolletii]SKX37539.1 Uncharacterised protein [Mycobacteroides abscessus subsp. bolletii]
MPQLELLDATEVLPQIHAAESAENDRFAADLRYATNIHAAPDIHGAAPDVLVANAIKIRDDAVRYVDECRRLSGIRRVTEHGADTAAAGSAHAESVQIPEFL